MKTWHQIAVLLLLGLVFETYTIFGVTPQGSQVQKAQSTNSQPTPPPFLAGITNYTGITNSDGIQATPLPNSSERQPNAAKEAPEKTISEAAGAERPQTKQGTQQSSESQSSTSVPSAGFRTGQAVEKSSAELQSEEAQAGARENREIRESAGAESLIEKIRTNLSHDPTTEAANVDVSVQGGKIVLKGKVNSETERQQIQRRVEAAIIDNQLEIAPSDIQNIPNK